MSRLATTTVLLTLLALVAPLTSLRGQGVFRGVPGAQAGRFIEPPRRVEQALRDAERALADQRYSDAVVGLGELLARESSEFDDEDLAGQDFLLNIDAERSRGVPLQETLLKSARDRIGQLPEQAAQTYRLRYEPLARRELQQAAERRDWEGIRAVRRRYFHTDAGYEASVMLAQRELYRGAPLAASVLLDDVVSAPRGVAHLGSGVVVLHTIACRLADRGDPGLIGSVVGKPVQIGEELLTRPTLDELNQRIEAISSAARPLPRPANHDYPLLGVQPDRNGGASGQLPLTNKRWDLVTTASPRQQREVRRATNALAERGKLPPPSWHPIRVGDHLLMRTTERLVGVDYRTGKRVWTYPWQAASPELQQDDQSLDVLEDPQTMEELLQQRVWNDTPYGQITSDGQRVFMLDALGAVELAAFGPMIQMRGTRPAEGQANTLVALDLASEGKLLWRVGAGVEGSGDLAAAFFLGPPLPLEGRLYVMAELAGDISLFCLDAATGDELWRQQLVALEAGGIESDPIRRVAGAVPSYQDGILVCPTGAGAIVAIDLADRMIRWALAYDPNLEMTRSVLGRGRGLDVDQLMQRWFSGAAIIADNTVLVTPVESDRLYGIDLLTGRHRFSEKSRVHARYLAGARDGRYFVVSMDEISAFDINTGRLIWNSPREMLRGGQTISGIGVFGADQYYLPTSTNELIAVSLADGKVLERRTTQYPLGNLVAAGGELISQSPTTLSVAFGQRSLEPLVNRMLAENPDDLEALIRKSELLIQRDDRRGALELLERARSMDPENDEIRLLSVTAMLGELRFSDSTDPQLIQSLDEMIERPAQRIEFLTLLARTALREQDYPAAVSRLIELTERLEANPLLEVPDRAVTDQAGHHCSSYQWIAARLAEVRQQASAADLAEINRRLEAAAAQLRLGTMSYLTQMVRLFEPFAGSAPLRSELQRRLSEENSLLNLERLTLGTVAPTPADLATLPSDRLLTLAETYAAGNLDQDALAVLELIDQDQVADAERIAEIRRTAAALATTADWADPVQLQWSPLDNQNRNFAFRQHAAATILHGGRQFQGWQLINDQTNTVSLRDPWGVSRRAPTDRLLTRGSSDLQAHISGGFMAVITTEGLTGINLYQLTSSNGETSIWDFPFDGAGNPVARGLASTTPFNDSVRRFSVPSSNPAEQARELALGPIIGDRVILLNGGTLSAIDLLTGEHLWRNSTAPVNGSVVSDGQRVAVVSPDTKRVDFFNLLDGTKVDSAPWTHGQRWASAGSHVLCYRDQPNDPRLLVELVNPFTGDVLLQHQSMPANRKAENLAGGYGTVVDHRYLAMLSSNGNALVWDLAEGREIARVELQAYADLELLNAMVLGDQILLLPTRRQQPSRQPQTLQIQTKSGLDHRTVDGVHAISLLDGELRWQRQFDEAWGCTLTQPAATPLLLLARSQFTYTVRSRRKSLDVLALDVRTGQDALPAQSRPVNDGHNALETRLVVQPAASRVIAHIGGETLTYTFGGSAEPEQE